MQCQAVGAASIEHGQAHYAFVLVFGSENVRDEVRRVQNINCNMAPGCCMYCRDCKQVCRLAAGTGTTGTETNVTKSLNSQAAAINAVVRQDADRALFECMQKKQVRLY